MALALLTIAIIVINFSTILFQFQNEFALFAGTNDHGRMRFGLNIYGKEKVNLRFSTINNLFTPTTIDECLETENTSAIPGIKNAEGQWETTGHPSRIIL